jgi:hypothetical protein
MKKLNSLLLSTALIFALAFIGSGLGTGASVSLHAQDTMLGKIGDKTTKVSKKIGRKTASGAKKTYRTTRRVGTTVGNRTWNGTKWVASNSWKGGKWVAVKTANGTKWVYRKGKRAVTGTKKRVM